MSSKFQVEIGGGGGKPKFFYIGIYHLHLSAPCPHANLIPEIKNVCKV